MARIAFRDLHVELDRPQLWELDGEVIGRTRQLRVTVRPGALLVRVPNRGASPGGRPPGTPRP